MVDMTLQTYKFTVEIRGQNELDLIKFKNDVKLLKTVLSVNSNEELIKRLVKDRKDIFAKSQGFRIGAY